jgi:periplasmic protein TonB
VEEAIALPLPVPHACQGATGSRFPATIEIPARPMAAAIDVAPGVLSSSAAASTRGPGSGEGSGSGTRNGIGEGDGNGLGPGSVTGTGNLGTSFGNGVTPPTVLREVRPNYTAEAMRAKVQGVVTLQCVVLPDGTVADVRIVKSLDGTFGLDQEAIEAARQWRFVPAKRQGEPVATMITIELTFNLR